VGYVTEPGSRVKCARQAFFGTDQTPRQVGLVTVGLRTPAGSQQNRDLVSPHSVISTCAIQFEN